MLHILNTHTSTTDSPDTNDQYSQLVLERDSRLTPALEEILKDVILADVSDYGVDLAVAKVFASYRPGTQRWEQLQYPNARWLTCKTEATVDQPSHTVHMNLFNGALRVNGQLLNGLPYDFREIIRGVCTQQDRFLRPSNLLGMDFTSLAMTSEHKVTARPSMT